MNNVKVSVTKDKTNRAGETEIVVKVKIPEYKPRKGVDHIRYDVVNARIAAVDKYGEGDVGQLTSDSPNPVLENKIRASGVTLEGEWHFSIQRIHSPTPASSLKTRTRTNRTRRSQKNKTTE